jgi:hypothetical protein
MLAFRVLAALYAVDGYVLEESVLAKQVADGKPLCPSALRNRCWQIFTENMVVASGSRWILLTAGVAEVEAHLKVVGPAKSPAVSVVGQVALPRTIQNGVTSSRPLSLAGIYANVRPDGITFRDEPSLMGSTRKLPSGEVLS